MSNKKLRDGFLYHSNFLSELSVLVRTSKTHNFSMLTIISE